MNIFHRVKNVKLYVINSDEPIEEVPCGTCTLCCEILAPNLTVEEINSGKYPISLSDNNLDGPVVTMFRKQGQKGCAMFIDGKCSIYDDRPIACRQFDCRKGHHPMTNEVAKEKFGVNVHETWKNGRIYYSEE